MVMICCLIKTQGKRLIFMDDTGCWGIEYADSGKTVSHEEAKKRLKQCLDVLIIL
jgi:hypothetical protein